MFNGQYYAQKKVGDSWVPTTTVSEGEVYRHWDPDAGMPASSEIVASQNLTIDIPIFVVEEQLKCKPCGRQLTEENAKIITLPGHRSEILCEACFKTFAEVAKEYFNSVGVGRQD